MNPRQDNLHAVSYFADVEDDRLDALSDVVRFARNLLAAGQNGFRLAQADRGGPALEPLHGAVNEISLDGGILTENGVAFRLTDLLNHDLFGALSGDAPQLGRLDDLLATLGANRARVPVDGDRDVVLFAVLFLHRQLHGGL